MSSIKSGTSILEVNTIFMGEVCVDVMAGYWKIAYPLIKYHSAYDGRGFCVQGAGYSRCLIYEDEVTFFIGCRGYHVL